DARRLDPGGHGRLPREAGAAREAVRRPAGAACGARHAEVLTTRCSGRGAAKTSPETTSTDPCRADQSHPTGGRTFWTRRRKPSYSADARHLELRIATQ